MDLPTFPLLDLRAGDEPGTFVLPVVHELCTPFEFLYGGSGIAASVEAAERAAGRPLVWITTQFLGSPRPGDRVDLRVELPAVGRVTTQTQVTGRVGGEVVFTSLAAHTERPAGDEAAFVAMPDVPPPADCPPMAMPFETEAPATFFDSLERRAAGGRFARDAVGAPQTEPLAMWCRIVGGETGSAATQAFVSDVVPLAICAALGVPPGGTSLDNTVRVVDARPSAWVLLELVADGFQRSIGHGTVRIWSDDGRLLGIHQQSAIIRTSHHRR